MTRYDVEITDAALAAIREQVDYIRGEAEAPLNAQLWLQAVLRAVESLAEFPGRGSRAEEDSFVDYDVRQLVVGSHLLLFTVDDSQRRVWILGLRHGRRRPRLGDSAEPGDRPDEGVGPEG